jgi:crotonobetainyl-CoA:carnitine CoA-transferase CaiB-like acyl-CoA transferase
MIRFPATGALEGMRVLDLGQALAGPLCAAFLADHGADVIKIEQPAGDPARGVGPFAEDDSTREYGAMFQYGNRNKRGMILDLKIPEGCDAFLKMVESADVIVENFRAGVMDRLGLGYEVLTERNPRIVYTSIRGFGDPRSGRTKYTDWPTVDVVAQAMGGLMGITGPDSESPTYVGGAPGDTVPALYAAFATMVAAWEARASGKGQYVDVGMIDSLIALNETITTAYSMTGEIPKPAGSRFPQIAPFGRISVKDGWAVLAVPPGRNWGEFCETIGRKELITDPLFSTAEARVTNMDEVYEVVEEFTRRHTKSELADIFGGKVPFAPIFDAEDIFADPYFNIRQMLQEVEQPGSKQLVTIPGVPSKLSRTPSGARHRAPLLGEHTEQILSDLGFNVGEVASLRAAGAITSDAASIGRKGKS